MSGTCDASPDVSPRLAVLGVFSIDQATHQAYRSAIRGSWMKQATASGFVAKFILRGLNANEHVIREQAEHGDIVFVRAPATMPRAVGPLQTLVLWFPCAVRSWPRAELIDVWLHLPGIAAHVLASLAALRTDGRVPHIYWGQHETYSWNTTDHLPVGFAHRYDRSRTGGRPAVCRNSAELTGTFSFAKGPLFLISASMVSDLIRDRAVQDEARAALAAAATRNLSRTYRVMPFEDAFSGYALATSARGSARARLVTVHTGWTVTAEGWGFQLAPSTLVWHMKLKSQPQRIVQADDWAAGHHCDLLPASLQCHPYDACNGARWTRCEAVYRTSPSTRTPGKTIEQFSVPAGLMERGRARNCSLEHHSDELVDLKHWRKDRVHIRA